MHSTNGNQSGTGSPDSNADADETIEGRVALGEPEVKLDDAAQALIGHHLKAVYGAIVQQPVPDRFLELLDELERKEQGR